MSARSFGRGLCLRIITLPIGVFLFGVAVAGVLTYRGLQAESDRLAHERVSALWLAVSGTTKLSSTSKLPAAAPTGTTPADPFIFRRVSRTGTDAETQPDPYEIQLFTTFSMSSSLQRVDGTITRQGQPTFVVAAPLRKSGSGAVESVEVLYVPVGGSYSRAWASLWTGFKLLCLMIALGCVILAWLSHMVIAVPLRRLQSASQALRRGEWGARFNLASKDELATLALSFQETTQWLREQIVKEEKLRALFQAFVPASVAAKALGKNPDAVLAGTRHPVTVMIINIRNFRMLADNLPPEQTVVALNEYFSEINRVIVAHKGVVSKYMGDTVMAIFGMPVPNKDHALHAVTAALAIPRALSNLYVRMEDKHGWELGVGIGIASGEPIVGHFGSSEHMEYTLLGDVVVQAHRMEKMTKSVPEEDTILISEDTYRKVMSDVHVYDLGEKMTPDGNAVHPYVVQGFRSEARSVLAA